MAFDSPERDASDRAESDCTKKNPRCQSRAQARPWSAEQRRAQLSSLRAHHRQPCRAGLSYADFTFGRATKLSGSTKVPTRLYVLWYVLQLSHKWSRDHLWDNGRSYDPHIWCRNPQGHIQALQSWFTAAWLVPPLSGCECPAEPPRSDCKQTTATASPLPQISSHAAARKKEPRERTGMDTRVAH